MRMSHYVFSFILTAVTHTLIWKLKPPAPAYFVIISVITESLQNTEQLLVFFQMIIVNEAELTHLSISLQHWFV